ncbi:hypothetical protein KAU33_01840 [Candidatus Dependentiae bacterium]|nr:hypothetical protein [Candidatus Dependentiae bacterium]
MTQDNLQPPPPQPPPIQGISVMPAPVNTSKIVIQIYGWFLMVIGVLILLVFCGVGLGALFSGESEGVAAGLIFMVIGFFIGLFVGAIGFISLKAAKAIEERKNWGRIFGIILAILSVANFPIGTLAAVFIFIGLFSKDAEGWFIN